MMITKKLSKIHIWSLFFIFSYSNVNSQIINKEINIQIHGIVLCNGTPIRKAKIVVFNSYPNGNEKIIDDGIKSDGDGIFKKRIPVTKGKAIYVSIIHEGKSKLIDKHITTQSIVDIGQVDLCEEEVKEKLIKVNTLNTRSYNSSNISIKSLPPTQSDNSRVIKKVNSGITFEVLDSTQEKSTISWVSPPNKLVISNDYWYKIRNTKLRIGKGWIHGAYTNKALPLKTKELKIRTKTKLHIHLFSNKKASIIGQIEEDINCKVLDIKKEGGHYWYKIELRSLEFSIQGWIEGSDENVIRM